MSIKSVLSDKSFRFFIVSCYLMVNLLVIFVIFDAYQSLSRDYAKLQEQNGELRVLAGLNALTPIDDETKKRYENYRDFLLKKMEQ